MESSLNCLDPGPEAEDQGATAKSGRLLGLSDSYNPRVYKGYYFQPAHIP